MMETETWKRLEEQKEVNTKFSEDIADLEKRIAILETKQ